MPSQRQHTVFQGRVVQLDLETVELPNGTVADFEIVRHPGGAAAVALDENARVCLLRHYRPAVDEWLWELPAGKLDGKEEPLLAARRELEEETGVVAGQWESLGYSISSPGVFTEIVHLYLATRLEHRRAEPDAAEVFEVNWLPLDQAVRMALAGEISDAKTVIGLCRAHGVTRGGFK